MPSTWALARRVFCVFKVRLDKQTRRVKTGGILIGNSTETYHVTCVAGLGIIQVPRVGVRELLRSGKLVEILLQYRAEPMPVSLIFPHRRNLSRRVYLASVYGVALNRAEELCRPVATIILHTTHSGKGNKI